MPRRPDIPPLGREDLDPDPFVQFAVWFDRAAEEAPLAEAMTLATVDADGSPDARMVLLKGADAARLPLLQQPLLGQGRTARRPARGGADPLLA